MGRVTRAAAHLPADEVKKRAKTDKRYWCRQRWLIIYNALVDPRPASEIATHVGVSVDTVHQVISKYNRWGVAAVETAGKGGRHNEYLTIEHERQLLAPFFARAETGEIATAGEIKRAFEAQVGHEVDESTIYRLLTRHGWRKLVPRPVHPLASKEEQEQFKKTLRRRLKRRLQRARQKTAGQS
jgi:transposase